MQPFFNGPVGFTGSVLLYMLTVSSYFRAVAPSSRRPRSRTSPYALYHPPSSPFYFL